jgi:hypothetical protein
LIWMLAAVLTTFGAILAHVIASDLYTQLPRVAVWLVERAVLQLPKIDQDRYREEWLAI